MSPTLDAYRNLRPDDARSDYEVLEGLVNQFTTDGSISQFPDLTKEWQAAQMQRRADMAPSYLGEGAQAIGSGVNLMQAKLYEGTAGLGGGLLGIDSLKKWGLEGYRSNMAEAQEYQPTVPQSTDVHDVDSALRYGISMVGQNVPQFAATLGTSAAIEGAGFLAGGPPGAIAAAPYAAAAAGIFGGIQNQNYADLLDLGGENPELTALGVGAISGYLETLVPLKMLNKFKGTQQELKPWLNQVIQTLEPSFRRQLLKAAAENAAGEGMTEAAQEAVSIAGEMFSNRNNPNFLLDPAVVTSRIRENAIAGALVGGIVSPFEAASEHYRSRREATPVAPPAPEMNTSAGNADFTMLSRIVDKIKKGNQNFTDEELAYYKNNPGVIETILKGEAGKQPTTATAKEQTDELPLKVEETKDGKTTEVPLAQYLTKSEPATTWSELEPVESGGDIVLRPKQSSLALEDSVIDVQTTPVRKIPALKQGLSELPETELPVERFKNGATDTEVVVALKDQMREHATKDAPMGATKRLFAYQDKESGEVYLAGAYVSSGGQVHLHTGQEDLPTRADIARELDVSEAAVKKALSPNMENRLNTDLGKRIRAHVQNKTYGLRQKNMSLKDLLALKSPSGETKFKPIASVTLKSLALQNASPWDVSTDYRVKYDTLADFEKVAGAADENAKAFQEQKANLSAARESRSKIYMDRMGQLEDGKRVSHAINILSSVLENEALKVRSLKVTPNAEAITIGLMRLWNPNILARELGRATSAYDLLAQTESKSTGAKKYFGFMDQTEFKDFVDAANSGDADLIKATLNDVLEEKGKTLRWFAVKAASIGDARQTHFSEIRSESDPSASAEDAMAVTDPDEVTGDNMQPDGVLTEDNLQEPDAAAPAKALSFVGLTNKEQSTIKQALQILNPELFKLFKDREGNVFKPVADWQNDPGFLAAKPALKVAMERTLGVSRKTTVSLTDEALYGAYLNGPVTVRNSQPLTASYRASTGTYRQLYYGALQNLARHGVDTKVVEQDIGSLVEQLKNEWGQARIYEDGRRAVTMTVQDILNPTKENYRVLLHEAAHIALANEEKWIQQGIHDAINRTASIRDQVLTRTTDKRFRDGSLYGSELADEVLAEHLSYLGIDRETSQGLFSKIYNFLKDLMSRVSAMYYKWRGLHTGDNAVKYMEARFQSFMAGENVTLQTLDDINGVSHQTIGAQVLLYKQSDGDVEVERLNTENGMIEPVEVIEDSTFATVLNLDTIQAAYDVAVAANAASPVQNTEPSIPEGYFLSGAKNLQALMQTGKAGKIKLANDGTIGSQEVKSFLSSPDVVGGANTAEWNYLKEMGIEQLITGNRVEVSKLLQFVKSVQPTLEVKPLQVTEENLSHYMRERQRLQHELETRGYQIRNDRAGTPHLYDTSTSTRVKDADLNNEEKKLYSDYVQVDNAAMGYASSGTDSASANYREVNPLSNKDLAAKGGVDLLLRIPVERDVISFRGPHYGDSDQNVVVSVRGHFETVDGKKVFSVNEVQSDWGQQVRGFKDRNTVTVPIENVVLGTHQELGLKMAMQYAVKNGATAIVLPDSKTVMMTEMHDRVPVESKNYLTEEDAQKDANRINVFFNSPGGEQKLAGLPSDSNLPILTLGYRAGFARVEKAPKGTYYIHVNPNLVPMIPKSLRDEIRFRVYSATGMEINYDQKLPSMAEKLTGVEGQPVSLGEHQNGPSPALGGKTDITGRMYDLANFKQKLIDNQGNSIFYSRWTKPADESWTKIPTTLGHYYNELGLNQNTGQTLDETLAAALAKPLPVELKTLAEILRNHWTAKETLVYMARSAEESYLDGERTAGYMKWNEGRMVLNPYLVPNQVLGSTGEAVLIHEALHAATASAIELWRAAQNIENKELKASFDGKMADTFKAVEELNKIFEYIKKSYPELTAGRNAFSSLHEFAADLFTDNEVLTFLKNITLPPQLSPKKENALYTVLKKILSFFNVSRISSLDAATKALANLLSATNEPIAAANLASYNAAVSEAHPQAKPAVISDDEARLKYQLEYRGAVINSRIQLYQELFQSRADALEMPLNKYVTDILRLNDPFEQREAWLVYVHNRPTPTPVNENLSIFPKSKEQTITNDVMKGLVTREVYKTVEQAKVKLQADQTKIAHDAKIAEKKLTRAQLNATRLDEYLNNVTELKADILKELRTAVREVTKDLGRVLSENEKLSSLANVLQQTLAKGIGEIPEKYRATFEKILSEAETSFAFTDALTTMAKLDIDWRNSDVETISDQIQAAYKRTRNPALEPFVGNDEEARASLALAIFYGKFNPRIMATLALRTEKVASEKIAAVRAIQQIIEGTEPNLSVIDDMISSGIKESGTAARVKVEFRQAQLNFQRLQRQLKTLKNRAAENEVAILPLKQRISELQTRLGIAAETFYIAQGAPVILTPDATADGASLKTSPLDLKAANSTKALTQIWIDNGKWLKKNEYQKDATWKAVEGQRAAIEKALGDQSIRHIKDFYVGKFLFSIPQKLTAIGLPGTRRIAQRFGDFFSKRMSMEAAQARGHEIVTVWNRAVKATGLNPETFRTLFWNPGNRYLETTAYLLGENKQENEANLKKGLKEYFDNNPQAAELFRNKPEVFDSIWTALLTNYNRGSSFMAELAQKWNVLVEDDFGVKGFRIDNPRGGTSRAYRKHLSVGYATTQRSVRNLAPVVRLMEGLWSSSDTGLTPENYTNFFTPEIVRLFVVPFITDSTYQHFPGPTMADGETRFYASNGNVREAWAKANNDIGVFSLNLYALEKGIPAQQAITDPAFADYQKLILNTFSQKFFQMHSLLERSSVTGNKLGLDSLPHQLMDARESNNLPSEFVDYTLYTPTTVHIVANQLAAVSAFGRDLGITANRKEGNKGLMWELDAAVQELEESISDANSRRALLRANNPLATQKQIENALEKELGREEYSRVHRVPEKINELKKIQDEIYLYFRRPNGDTRDVSWFMEGIRTLAGLMVNNFKTTAFATMTLFDNLFGLRLNKTGMSVVKNNWAALTKTGWTSVAEAFGMQLSKTSETAEYLKRFKDLGIMQDLGNMIDGESILADPGHKYSYLNDSKVLGYLRKGRQFYFNLGVKTQTGVKIRPLAPFASGNTTINIAAVMGSLGLYKQVLNQASDYFLLGKMQTDFENAGFTFKPEMFPDIAPDAFAELRAQFEDMGTTLEVAARKVVENKLAGKLGLEQVPDDMTRNIAAQTIRNVTLQSDITTAPPWLFTNSFGRMVSPLLTWPMARVGQIMKSMGDANGEVGLASVRSFLALMMFGIVPAGIAMTMLLDKYDEDILGKKSNLASFTASGDVNQNLTALVERLGRAGTFGLAGDVVNGVRIYGSDGDLRGLSFDQRVLFANTLLTTMGLFSTVAHQGGDVTYATFWRPLMNTMGGSGYLQNAQILNNLTNSVTGAPVFAGEAQVTERINAQNYLRAAGRVLGMDVRTGSGQRSIPTPVRPWVTNMVLAAYSGDSVGFIQAYQKALAAAREMGQDDPAEYVKRSYATYHPLKSVFRTPPTASDVSRLYVTMGGKGSEDVRGAVRSFDAFGKTIGLKPFDPKESTQKSLPKTTAPVLIR